MHPSRSFHTASASTRLRSGGLRERLALSWQYSHGRQSRTASHRGQSEDEEWNEELDDGDRTFAMETGSRVMYVGSVLNILRPPPSSEGNLCC
jgi:hypothetical protein